jgi:shikimate dehydrogenase
MMTLSGKARIAGVMGWPVGQSRSPALHGYWLERHGIDGAYVPLPVAPDNLADCLASLAKLGLVGVNLTVPHKEAALALMDRCSMTSRRIGAVNTVVTQDDGSLHGDNTDAFGFIENLRAEAGHWSASAGPVTVLGAGGAARAVCVALADAGVTSIRLANRTASRAEALARELDAPIEAWPWDRRSEALADTTLLVNTTTLGMAGSGALEIDLSALPAGAVVNDIVYAPLRTPLLAAAGARGLAVVDGLGMLLHQARPGFRAWFGVDPEVTPELRAHIVAGLEP